MAVSEQPMRKLLGVLSPTIFWLSEQGSVAISAVPANHLEAIKQLERIGIVYKRNNRSYELQKIRLKKLLGNVTLESLLPQDSLDCDPVGGPDLKGHFKLDSCLSCLSLSQLIMRNIVFLLCWIRYTTS